MKNQDLAWFNNPKVGFYPKDINSVEGKSTVDQELEEALKILVGSISGLLIYMFIFLFGAQIMKSVSEEKTSRIVEVLVSSIKPVQLLMGKVFAIALVGLTQFLLWIVLSYGVISLIELSNPELFSAQPTPELVANQDISENNMVSLSPIDEAASFVQSLLTINYPLIISMFLFFFISGYLLYGFLFGACGALADVDTDAQQFTLPITMPLIISMVCLPAIISDPSGQVAFWLSIFPFTSPVIMMVRIPFGVEAWEILLSMGMMILFIIGTMLMAAKIYRTGILMYGKAITYKEIWKWLTYRNK